MAKKTGALPPHTENIFSRTMETVIHESMMPYAEYVILDRAIPRVEDGLKPVQRRILYSMLELGMTPDKPHRKSARIVGDCLGKYHPHGDTSVYEAMVRMAQDFNMQCPLINGHGNFGSIDGDPAAAMRYTEARLMPLALELLRDIEKDTVPFSLNFDDTLKEPDILPGRYPNLLVNGASGIAVGLATSIPPHNLTETIEATIAMLDNPNISLDKLMHFIKAPDFPTGGFLMDTSELYKAYETGRGKVVMRAKTHIEEQKNGRKLIVIDQLPYQVNKASALEKVLKLSEDKRSLFSGIYDIRDESDRTGMRAIIELRKEADAEKTLNYLYKYSDLQLNFSINMVVIAEGKPQLLGLRAILAYYVAHQKQVVTRRTKFDLEAAQKRAHILEGLIIAVDNIDKMIQLIRSSQNGPEARVKLMNAFNLSEVQAQAILDLRLQRLTNLQILELRKEFAEVSALIVELQAILNDEKNLIVVIKKELNEVKKKYGFARRTQILDETPEIIIDEKDLKTVEDAIVFITDAGIKRTAPKPNNGKAVQDDSRVQFSCQTRTDRRVQLFTNMGNMYALDVEDVPLVKGKERGALPGALLQGWQDGERIIEMFSFEDYPQDDSLFFVTAKGMIKRTVLSEYCTRNKRIATIKLRADDEIIAVWQDNRMDNILLVTKEGLSIRFGVDAVPKTGRATAGVKGIALEREDCLVFANLLDEIGELLILSDRGYAKRLLICDFDIQGRNGKGVKCIDFKKNHSNGEEIVAAFHITQPSKVIVEQFHGDKTTLSTEEVLIEKKGSKGVPMIMVLLDNVITGAYLE